MSRRRQLRRRRLRPGHNRRSPRNQLQRARAISCRSSARSNRTRRFAFSMVHTCRRWRDLGGWEAGARTSKVLLTELETQDKMLACLGQKWLARSCGSQTTSQLSCVFEPILEPPVPPFRGPASNFQGSYQVRRSLWGNKLPVRGNIDIRELAFPLSPAIFPNLFLPVPVRCNVCSSLAGAVPFSAAPHRPSYSHAPMTASGNRKDCFLC